MAGLPDNWEAGGCCLEAEWLDCWMAAQLNGWEIGWLGYYSIWLAARQLGGWGLLRGDWMSKNSPVRAEAIVTFAGKSILKL